MSIISSHPPWIHFKFEYLFKEGYRIKLESTPLLKESVLKTQNRWTSESVDIWSLGS